MDVLDLTTEGAEERMIGNFAFETEFGSVVGFENHSGRTRLGPNAKPLGRVLRGFGNNGEDGGEGARYKNVFGTYSHGPCCPRTRISATASSSPRCAAATATRSSSRCPTSRSARRTTPCSPGCWVRKNFLLLIFV